jgi:poly(ribitol-phosphate) beta-N-acetylglucosaminyltransferase
MTTRPAEVAVSVVIPVYNTRPYLADCLDSVLAQDLGSHGLEVIAVDDGSTDGSAELLDRYAEGHANLRVIHQENSGWPGRPRNVGRAASRGEYVFFVDSDDCLAPDALRSIHDFAVQHDSDIVVPKIVPLDGFRRPNQVVWGRSRVDAELTRVIQTLGPWKLFRRALLDEQDIWFPEGKLRLEDGIFVTQAYLAARRVSVLADGEYYRKRSQPDRGNISSTPVDPERYLSSIARMIEIIRRNCSDEQVADALVATLYRRKALKWFGPDRFPDYGTARRTAWVQAVRSLQDGYVPPRLDDQLSLAHRTRSVLVRNGEVAALASIATAQRADRPLEAVLVGGWVQLRVPGLMARPTLVVAPGFRLVAPDAGPVPARGPRRSRIVVAAARSLRPLAHRSARGRAAWARVRRWFTAADQA